MDVRLSETRDMAAATAFFRPAKTVTGVTPARVTTDGHDSYPGKAVRHRTSRYLNNRIEQDHRGIKSHSWVQEQPVRCPVCKSHDELRNFLRSRSNRNQHVPANHHRLHLLSRSVTALSILKAA